MLDASGIVCPLPLSLTSLKTVETRVAARVVELTWWPLACISSHVTSLVVVRFTRQPETSLCAGTLSALINFIRVTTTPSRTSFVWPHGRGENINVHCSRRGQERMCRSASSSTAQKHACGLELILPSVKLVPRSVLKYQHDTSIVFPVAKSTEHTKVFGCRRLRTSHASF